VRPAALAWAVLLALGAGGAQAAEWSTYQRSGGLSLGGHLCTPPGGGPFPVVVYNHGGAGRHIGGAPEETCAALASAGFVGFSPMRRRSRALPGHRADVMAAIDHAKRLPRVDRRRIGVIGFSRGGMLAFQAAARRRDVGALVIMASAMGRGGRGLDLGRAAAIEAPVLILVAKNDTGSRRTMGTNTLDGSRRLAGALEAAGKEVRLVVYPPHADDGHTLFFRVGAYWADVVAFLRLHLRGTTATP
jgi:dienelactone hydrolase